MAKQIKDETIYLWKSLMRASERALAFIEAELATQSLPPLNWYDALLEIEKAGKEGIRPYALKDKLLLPQYGTSRLLSKIENAGLISRIACDTDGRGHAVKITKDGRETRRKMWPVYEECLKKLLEDRFSASEIESVASRLDQISPPDRK